MKFNRRTDKTIRMRPARAEVSNSLAAWTLFGSPAAVAIWKPAKTIMRKAIPPPTPTPQPKSWEMNCLGSPAIRQPMAVLTPLLSVPHKGDTRDEGFVFGAVHPGGM